jgi:hypothetical protein
MQRGAPFVADLRIQWLNLAQGHTSIKGNLPPVIHLLGDRDDIVSTDDSRDIAASPGVRFVTLADTDHQSILNGLNETPLGSEISPRAIRRRMIEQALKGDINKLPGDVMRQPAECPRNAKSRTSPVFATRVVYVMHGIRRGGHSAGVDVADKNKLAALVGFVIHPDPKALEQVFKDDFAQNSTLAFASNVSWTVWIVLALGFGLIGVALWVFRVTIDFTHVPHSLSLGTLPFYLFLILVVLLLFSV